MFTRTHIQKLVSGFIAAVGLLGCLYALYWLVAHPHAARFSFLFAAAVFAIFSMHWLLEELDLVRPGPSRLHES